MIQNAVHDALGIVKNILFAWLSETTGLLGKPLDKFGIDPKLIENLKPFFQFLYYVYFRVDVKGAENVPKKGSAILVANHSGAIPYDGTMMHLAVANEHPLSRRVRFLVENFVFGMPLLSDLIQRLGGVRACHENAEALIKKGELVAVFPEGVKGIGKTYDERYKLKEFGKGGYIKLAMRTRTPIVPVAVIGAEEIHPIIWRSKTLGEPLGIPFIPFTPTFPWLGPLGLVPLPTKWRIVFGRPVRFDKMGPQNAKNDELVQKYSDIVRNTVQKMINSELKRRRSIWA